MLPGSGAYGFGPYDIHCADELLHDMGLPPTAPATCWRNTCFQAGSPTGTEA